MKNIIISILMLITFAPSAYSQTAIKKSSISSGGGLADNGTTNIIYTVGELAIREQTQGNTHISEGFISPDIKVALKAEDYSVLSGIKVFPNPVKDNLYINNSNKDGYEIHLFDIEGKEVLVKPDNIHNVEINMNSFPTGVYVVAIVDRKNKKIKTFKIRKQ